MSKFDYSDAADRFWSKVLMPVKDGYCWRWTAATSSSGYGRFWYNGKLHQAHRVSFCLTKGIIPAGKHVLHTCDNRRCVSPDHLFLGTHQDNMKDRDIKGRSSGGRAFGTDNPCSILDEDSVRKIRLLYQNGTGISQAELARIFSVTDMTIHKIVKRKTWKNI